MARCTKCRFLFESPTRGLLPDCPQCGGSTMLVVTIEPSEPPPAMPTMKFLAVRSED
ncbi:MAG TPA: Zn-ribbon containing protein [Polyangia bacterium]|jgi:predicted  nucleic acid-binding Zn-ribbon protein